MCSEKQLRDRYLIKRPFTPNRFVYHVTLPDFQDAINVLGLIPRNDIGFGPRMHYPPAVFANNLPINQNNRWFPFSENKARSFYEGTLPVRIEDQAVWEIDTTMIPNKWLLDHGTGKKGDCIYTLEAVPREAIRLLRITHPDHKIRNRDGVTSIYYTHGVREILPRQKYKMAG
jgi:hypothetical protein